MRNQGYTPTSGRASDDILLPDGRLYTFELPEEAGGAPPREATALGELKVAQRDHARTGADGKFGRTTAGVLLALLLAIVITVATSAALDARQDAAALRRQVRTLEARAEASSLASCIDPSMRRSM